MNKPPEAFLLRLAVQNLANAPQAQRRYVQLGMMPTAIDNLERLGSDPQNIQGGEEFSNEGAAMISELRDDVLRQLQAHEDFMEQRGSGPREFLFSSALENDDWERIRQLARRCHTEISGEMSAFLALMAK